VSQPPGIEPFLAHLAGALQAVGIEYAVVGSVASSFHGEPRGTQDIDIVARVSRSDVVDLARQFPEADFYFDRDMVIDSLKTRQPFNIIDLRSMWKADIILPREPYAGEQLARRQRVELGGVLLFVASAEDTVISKMRWSQLTGSDRQLQDVAGIVRVRGPALDSTLISALVGRFGLEAEWARVLEIAST
jgi:hypothetical protein